MKNNNYRNQEQDRRLENVEKHLGIINDELGTIKVDVAEVKQDVKWLKRFFWIISTASISGLIVGIINLLIKP